MRRRKMTKTELRRLNACNAQVDIFIETFPKGAPWTPGSFDIALEAGLDMYWLAKRFLSPDAISNIDRVSASFRREYHLSCDSHPLYLTAKDWTDDEHKAYYRDVERYFKIYKAGEATAIKKEFFPS